jgi:N-acetylneuraminic acid mutarotase
MNRDGVWLRAGLAAAVAIGGTAAILLLAGGDDEGDAPETVPGEWRELSPAPLSQVEMGAARIGGFIYGAGGLVPPDETTNQVVRYEIAADRWDLAEGMIVAVNHPGVTAAGGKLYVHGGYTVSGDEGSGTSALQCYDPATGEWVGLEHSRYTAAANTLAAVGGKLYSIGGVRDGSQQRTVQVYDIATDTWSEGPETPEPAREHLASAVVGDRIYILGGRAPGANFDLVDVLDTGGGEWSRAAPMENERSGMKAATLHGRIVIAGGEELVEGGVTIPQTEIYDPDEDRWAALPDMPTPRHGAGLVTQGRTLYVFAGGPEPALSFTDVFEALEIPRGALSSR